MRKLSLDELSQLYSVLKGDEYVKSRKTPFFVIPAKAGNQSSQGIWTPAFAGVTALGTFYEAVKGDISFVGRRPALFNQKDMVALRTKI